jgi:hypothetical protein
MPLGEARKSGPCVPSDDCRVLAVCDKSFQYSCSTEEEAQGSAPFGTGGSRSTLKFRFFPVQFALARSEDECNGVSHGHGRASRPVDSANPKCFPVSPKRFRIPEAGRDQYEQPAR